jgi:hypothetical protein
MNWNRSCPEIGYNPVITVILAHNESASNIFLEKYHILLTDSSSRYEQNHERIRMDTFMVLSSGIR